MYGKKKPKPAPKVELNMEDEPIKIVTTSKDEEETPIVNDEL